MQIKERSNIALMVFSLSSKMEAKRKRIVKGNSCKNNELIFQQLITDTKSLSKSVKLDLIWVDESRQIGESFGEKFSNAFETTFELGYERIIAIGNDSPDLKVSHLESTIIQLNYGQAVCGPSTDGGIYLLGMHKSQFKKEKFSELNWQTDSLQESIQAFFKEQSICLFKLEELADIDHISTLLAYASSNPLTELAQICKKLFLILQTSIKPYIQIWMKEVYHSHYYYRGPPVAILA